MSARRPVDPTIRRLQARLHRWELPHLRELAAQQAQRIEELERQLARAERQADDYWNQLECEREAYQAEGGRLGLSQDGQVHALGGGAA